MHASLTFYHSVAEEKELVQLILDFARAGFPLTSMKIRCLAYEYAEMNDLKGFSPITQCAGPRWMRNFMKRHPILRRKTAHNLSINRAMCANPTVMAQYFKQLEQIMRDNFILNPTAIWNCDETGVQDIPKTREVIAEKGKRAHTIVSREQGETTTVLTFVNAAGECVPPLVIHKGGKVSGTWTDKAPPGVMVRCSDNGWINKELFTDYSARWTRWMRMRKYLERPQVLLLDSHKSHVYNLRFLRLMREMKIIALAIPKHTSHMTQPLDDRPFQNFKNKWYRKLHEYFFESAGHVLPKQDFFDVFWPAWIEAMTPAVIKSAFRNTGIYPLNPDMIPVEKMGPSSASDNLAIMGMGAINNAQEANNNNEDDDSDWEEEDDVTDETTRCKNEIRGAVVRWFMIRFCSVSDGGWCSC